MYGCGSFRHRHLLFYYISVSVVFVGPGGRVAIAAAARRAAPPPRHSESIS